MKTHKNPELRASSIIKAGEGKPASKASPKYGAANTANKPPVLALQGKKWVVVSIGIWIYFLLVSFCLEDTSFWQTA